MPKILYVHKKIRKPTIMVIAQAIKIIEKYEEQGLGLTLRQLYYQFVSHDAFPDDRTWRWTGSRWVRDPNGTKNAEPNYKWLGSAINDARMMGLIDWNSIEDRTRNLRGRSSFKDPKQVIGAAASSYHLDRWANQACRVEVWCEKEALIGVFSRVATAWDCPYFACKGYPSQSAKWEAAQRMLKYQDAGQHPVVLYFGDHDPSGIDITRDLRDSFTTFGASVYVERLALNMDQVEEFKPPPNPAKMTDSRAGGYVDRYGRESWELDALDPPVLMQLVEDSVKKYRDIEKWSEVVEREKKDLALLKTVRTCWPKVWSFLNTQEAHTIELAKEDIAKYETHYNDELIESEHDGEGIANAMLGGSADFCSGCGKLVKHEDVVDTVLEGQHMCWDCWDKER